MKKTNQTINAAFTPREMRAITSLLLASKGEGINVDPIVNDLYPQLNDEQKELFRCKIALLLSGKLPEFKSYQGYKRTGTYTVNMYEVVAESTLLGIRQANVLKRFKKQDDDTWVEEPWEESTALGMEEVLYDTMQEAIESW